VNRRYLITFWRFCFDLAVVRLAVDLPMRLSKIIALVSVIVFVGALTQKVFTLKTNRPARGRPDCICC
jgi:hypothetical protein